MRLYFSPGACSLAPHIALQELGLPHQLEKVDIAKGEVSSPEHLLRNPLGMVPVLELDDGQRLTECAAILQYLADLSPASGLVPAGGMARVRLWEWLSLLGTEVHKSFLPLFYGKNMVSAELDSLQHFYRERLKVRWQLIAQRLGERTWLMDEYSVADIYLYVLLNWWRFLRLDLDEWPNLQQFLERMKARPAVQRAHQAER